jgi:dihydroorotate dehydrogenase electron transfer subunit
MEQAEIRVVETEEIYPDTYVTWYSGEPVADNAQPGQFVMMQPRMGLDPFLPRAFSFYRFRDHLGEREFALLYHVVGKATAIMAAQKPGDTALATGPLGNGFQVRSGARNLLLVGGGVGIAPLVALADAQNGNDRSITLCFGARSATDVYPAELLPPEIEYAVATEDGSLGHEGLVTDLFANHLDWADQTLACGPIPMFRSMSAIVREDGMRRPTQILMETEMACGYGICYGCAVFTRKGVRLCCKDGPRFELLDVFRK